MLPMDQPPPSRPYITAKPAIIQRVPPDLLKPGRIKEAILPGIIPLPPSGGILLDFIGQLGSTTSGLTTVSFGSLTFPNDALAVVAFAGLSTNNVVCSSISIGGTNGTLHAANASSTRKVGIASRVVAAGPLAISVTMSGSGGSSASYGVGVWALRRLKSATPTGAAGNDASSTTCSISHNQASPGVAIYCSMDTNTGSSVLSSAQTVYYRSGDANGRTFTYASSKNVATQTPHTEILTINTSTNVAIVGGAWQ